MAHPYLCGMQVELKVCQHNIWYAITCLSVGLQSAGTDAKPRRPRDGSGALRSSHQWVSAGGGGRQSQGSGWDKGRLGRDEEDLKGSGIAWVSSAWGEACTVPQPMNR